MASSKSLLLLLFIKVGDVDEGDTKGGKTKEDEDEVEEEEEVEEEGREEREEEREGEEEREVYSLRSAALT